MRKTEISWRKKLGVMGLDGYTISHSREDVNGKWGGYKAWVVHYNPDTTTKPQRVELYRHVGEYYEVGNWPDDYGPSKWEVVTCCVDFINGDVSLVVLCKVLIEYYIKSKWGNLGRLLLTLSDFKSSVFGVFNRWRLCNAR